MSQDTFGVVLPPRRAFSTPIEIVRHQNVVAWLVQDRSVPVVSLAWSWPGGAAFDPPGQEGRAGVGARLLTEGAGDLRASAFSDALRDLGASLEISAQRDACQGSLRALEDALPAAVQLARQAHLSPRFDEDAFDRVRAQAVAAARRALESPQTIARRAFWASAFPGHPAGRMATPETIGRLDLADAVIFHQEQILGSGIRMGVSGAIGADGVRAVIDALFGGLSPQANPLPDPLPTMAAFDPVQAAHPGPQSTLVFGHDALSLDDPDWEASQVALRILGGGGLTSRLMEKVRDRRGLTYGIGAGLDVLKGRAILQGGVSTDNATAGLVWRLVREAWSEMAERGPTPEETAEAVSSLAGALPLQFADSRSAAQTLLTLQQLGRTPSWLVGRAARLDALTRDQVARAAARVLQPQGLRIAIAGTPQGL